MNEAIRMISVYQRRYLKYDLISGLVVFLVAIPLCLGIALASGAPLFSGLLAGIIGGIIVGSLSESHVSVSGPAAGMVVIVLGAMTQLGYHTFLLAVVLAGIIQILVGSMRVGFITEYVPSNVIQGLLCAIGILLIIKQLPLAFTHATNFSELSNQLHDTTESFSYGPLLHMFYHINYGALTITVVSLALLLYFDKTKNVTLKAIPAPILVVILGIVLNEISDTFNWYLTQDSPQLVNIPLNKGLKGFVAQFESPNWAGLLDLKVYLYAFVIAAVASLESLLNLKASERIDVFKRRCSKDRELVAQGVGNTVSGLIGGLPVTSVVVRSTVNAQAGSKTKASTIFHGFFILFAVMLLPHWLNKIPLASLAAILLHVGYKLTSPKIYKEIYAQGWERFASFIITVVSIVVFNLLVGILIGLVVSLFFILKSNGQERLDIIKEQYPTGEVSRLVLPQYATFLNKASLIAELDSIESNTQLIIDARYSKYLDKEIMELVNNFKAEQAPQKKIATNLLGFKDHYEVHDHIDFIHVTTYDTQAALSPRQVLNVLKEGNQRFLSDTRIHRAIKTEIEHTSNNQHPIAVVLGCIDSRVPVETIFDVGFGDIFCIRIAGNIVNDDVLASMEYACNVVGAKLIVVLGHTQCGAIKAAYNSFEQGLITQLLAKINPAIAAINTQNQEKELCLDQVAQYNVANTINQVVNGSESLNELITKGDIGVAGAIYNVESGKVVFEDYAEKMQVLTPDSKPIALTY